MDDDIYNPDHNPVRYVAEFFGGLSYNAVRTSNVTFNVVGRDAGKLTFSVVDR
jgi:hypothetical protein